MKWVIKKSKDGKFYFTLHAQNGETIATSEMYETRAACVAGIEAVKHCAQTTTIEDQHD